MIPTIEMTVLTESGLDKKPITFKEAIEQKELGSVRIGEDEDYRFEFEHYLEKLEQTQWANAWMTFHKGLNGTYEEATDGSVFWEHEDVEWFETQILGL